MPEYDAGSVKATMTTDTNGVHTGIERTKKDFRDLAQAIADAMRIVKKEENEATKAERERQAEMQKAAKIAKEAADAEKRAAQERKETYKELGLTAGISFAAIAASIWKATEANNQLKASMMGMDSIASGVLGNYDKIKNELIKIKSEGMIPLTNAIQAYKNLILRYQDEDKAIVIFNRLADAAAFARQGHLSLGEAIQGASEGLKNEMSQLVDNAGVTKNVSQMWADYGAQIGKGAMSLSLAEKRQAEFNGIMQETQFQVGDLVKLQKSLSGEMSKASAETTMVAAAMGDALEPAMGAVVGQFSGLMKNVKDFIQASPGLTAGITTGALALTGLITVTSTWIALDIGTKIAAGFTALTGPVGLTVIALSSLTSVLVGVATAEAKAREENIKLADKYRDESLEVKGLITEYQDLQKIVKPTADQKQRILDLSNKIAQILPGAITGWDNEGNAIISVNSALKEMILLKSQELRLRLSEINLQEKDNMNKQRKMQANVDYEQSNIDKLNEFRDEESGKLNAAAQKELNESESRQAQYNRQLKGLQDEHQKLIAEEKAINDLLDKGITSETIKSTTKPTTSSSLGTEKIDKSTQKSLQEQKDLEQKLWIEHLQRLKQFKEAELEEEDARYEKERELAQNNAGLLEAAYQGHKERVKIIDDKYNKEKLDRERKLNDEIIQMIGTKEEKEFNYIQNHIEEMKQMGYSDTQVLDWLTAYNKQKANEMKDLWSNNIQDMIKTGDFWGAAWQRILDHALDNFIDMLVEMVAQQSWFTGFMGLLGLGGGSSGAVGGAIPAFSKGGIVEPMPLLAASRGMVVPPSFGTDTVPAMLTPKEMVLDTKLSQGIQDLINKGGSGDTYITNNYINAIDTQSFQQALAKPENKAIIRGHNAALKKQYGDKAF